MIISMIIDQKTQLVGGFFPCQRDILCLQKARFPGEDGADKRGIFQIFLRVKGQDQSSRPNLRSKSSCLRSQLDSGLDVAHVKRGATNNENRGASGQQKYFRLKNSRPRNRILKHEQPAFEMMSDKPVFVAVKERNVFHHHVYEHIGECEDCGRRRLHVKAREHEGDGNHRAGVHRQKQM